MKKFTAKVKSFLLEEDGVTAIEYGLIAALIAVAIIVVVGNVGGELKNTFTKVETGLKNAPATP